MLLGLWFWWEDLLYTNMWLLTSFLHLPSCIWGVEQVQWMITTLQSVPICVTSDTLCTPSWACMCAEISLHQSEIVSRCYYQHYRILVETWLSFTVTNCMLCSLLFLLTLRIFSMCFHCSLGGQSFSVSVLCCTLFHVSFYLQTIVLRCREISRKSVAWLWDTARKRNIFLLFSIALRIFQLL